MISVCRFTLHRDIIFMCESIWLPNLHALPAPQFSFFSLPTPIHSFLFIFANYFTVLQWFHLNFSFFTFCLFVIEKTKMKTVSAVYWSFSVGSMRQEERYWLSDGVASWRMHMDVQEKKKKYGNEVFKAQKRRNIAGDTSLPEGRRSIHRLFSLWLLRLQINKVNCQFIWLSGRLSGYTIVA